uniref:Coiled-coil-helix-coiled-coil-helix domain-containing protein 7 n=1 Tax=Cacopsylla melanoneura TaxID=428564 RepID=A0A8D9BBG0_9HEMI
MSENKAEPKYYLEYKRNHARNQEAIDNNPCAKENDISMKCLDKNNYIKAKCEREFENYKICRKFWSAVARDRSDKGLPLKMTAEEREQAKADFKKEIETKIEIARKKFQEYNRLHGPQPRS